jgi:DNA primase catalytic core
MARAPQSEIDRYQREISVERLAEAKGVKLRRAGRNLMGLCPFHNDKNPSLAITPEKNVWHCLGACNKGGGAIEWVMYAEGVSFRHALEILREDHLPLAAANGKGEPPKKSTVPKLPVPIDGNADDRALMMSVVGYYNEMLAKSPEAMKYLAGRGLKSSEMIGHFKLGFANRTLGYGLPQKNRAAGAETRGRLQELGLIRESGHEHFNGSIVVPIFDAHGQVVQMYGRKITAKLRAGTPDHLYLPGPHRGVWNEQALAVSKEIIVCEALIDALTFWCAGYRHVTTSYGINGFTEELRAAFKKYGTKKIYLAYDRDEAGERAAREHSEELMAMGIECCRVQFPKNMDANEYAVKVTPAAKSLGVLLNRAEWLGRGKRPTATVIEPQAAAEKHEAPIVQAAKFVSAIAATVRSAEEKTETAAKEENAIPLPALPAAAENVLPLAAEAEAAQPGEEDAHSTMPLPSAAAPMIDVPTEIIGEDIFVTQGDRRYRIRGLAKNTTNEVLRVNVMAQGTNLRGEFNLHVDTFDLNSARHRAQFVKQAAEEMGIKEEIIRRDLGRVWLKMEELQRQQIDKALEKPEGQVEMSAEEKAAALALLNDPKLMERILSDFERCGIVGEESNKKISYLAAVSRLLPSPLAVVVQSASASGKSSLMEAVLALLPDEQCVQYSAMTGQSLFYMGEKELKHKVLAIVEEEGAQRAAYALKLLQSEGVLTIASTGKDANTGRLITHQYRVEGPVMIFLTTTAVEMDEELLNRCLVLTVDEDAEQTKAIHQKQREAQTLEGLWARQQRAEIVALHRNAQRLLKPISIVNERAPHLSFPYSRTRTRRDHMKFLTLINAITMLHQYQRPVKTDARNGKTVEYIEASEEDVKLAWNLVNEVLVRSLDELPPQTRRLLLLIEEMVSKECDRLNMQRADYRFSRRTVRHWTSWGDSQLKKHLHRLEELEYLIVHRGGRGQSFVYELDFAVDENGKPVVAGLAYQYDEKKSRSEGQLSPSSHAQVTGVAQGGHGAERPAMTMVRSAFNGNREKNTVRDIEQKQVVVVPPAKANGAMRAAAARAGAK